MRLLVATVALSAVLGVGCAWLVERSGVLAGGPLARPAGGTARGAGVRERLRLGLHHPRGAELPGRRHGRHPVLLPAGLPADRRRAASRSTPAWRRSPPRSAAGRWGVFFRVVLPTISPARARRRAAGRAAPAGGVRRPAAAELPDPDHRDPRPVPLHLQRTGGRAAGGGAGRVLRGAGRARAARRGSSPPRPGGCRRSAHRRGHVAVAVAGPGRWRRAPGRGAAGARRSRSAAWSAGWCGAPPRRSPPATSVAATLSTVGLALAAGALAAVAAAPLAWLAVRHRGWAAMFLERSTYIAQLAARDRRGARPGDRRRSGSCPALYQTLPVLVVGYVILFLPRAVVTRPVHPRAGAARARGRRAQPRLRHAWRRPAG